MSDKTEVIVTIDPEFLDFGTMCKTLSNVHKDKLRQLAASALSTARDQRAHRFPNQVLSAISGLITDQEVLRKRMHVAGAVCNGPSLRADPAARGGGPGGNALGGAGLLR